MVGLIGNNIRTQEKINIPSQSSNTKSSSSVFDGKTHINGAIDDFKQGNTGDCYLLAQLSGLRHKDWGREIVKQAIKSDGKGGAIITFKGAIGEQKEFRVTKEEILAVRKKQSLENLGEMSLSDIEQGKHIEDAMQYSTGDDDVLAIELALSKYNKMQGYNTIEGGSLKPREFGDIIYLLSGNIKQYLYNKPSRQSGHPIATNLIQKMSEIEKNPNNSVNYVSFLNNDLGLQTQHAYELKKIKKEKCGHKVMIFVNPWDSSKEIKINYYDAMRAIKDLHQSDKTNFYEGSYSEGVGFYPDGEDFIGAKEFDKNLEKFKANQEHKRCEIELEKEQITNEFFEIIKIDDKENRVTELEKYLNQNSTERINNYLKSNCAEIIKTMDDVEWGWGKGKAKKQLMTPLIEYVAKQAEWQNIDEKEINEFKEKCNKELDAWFYTDENKIIEAFKEILAKFSE